MPIALRPVTLLENEKIYDKDFAGQDFARLLFDNEKPVGR
jgi:hypothetical protein